MKRLTMVLACFALVSMAVSAQTAKIALQHNGNVTLYDADKMTDAMTAAADGDTLYLNEGTFGGDVTITKKVSIIGSGAATILDGAVKISIPDTPTLTAHLLDALNIQKSITVTLPVNDLKIRKCQFVGMSFDAKVEGVTFDRCYHRGGTDSPFRLSSNVKQMNAINSKFWYITGNAEYAGDANFVNCNIYEIYNSYSSYGRATYMNCIIREWQYSGSSYHSNTTTYVNCLCGRDYFTNSVNQNCWNYGNTNILGNGTNCSLTDDQLKSNNYLGTDGTVVGITGGSTPFTLVPSVPKVSEYTIKVDTQTKKLNVNIKVSAN